MKAVIRHAARVVPALIGRKRLLPTASRIRHYKTGEEVMQVKQVMSVRLAVLAVTAVLLLGMGHSSQAIAEKDDFYQAVNQETLKTKTIEPTEVSWSWFQERSVKNTKQLEAEVEQIAAKAGTYEKGTPEQKIADLYTCAMDTKTRNASSRTQLNEMLKPIQEAKTTAELTQALCDFKEKYGEGLLVDYGVDRRPSAPVYMSRISVNDTILTKYDLLKEPEKGLWNTYKTYIADVLKESGVDANTAKTQAAAILAMEQAWAPAMTESEKLNDASVYNQVVPRKDVEAWMPHMDGKKVLASWGLAKEKDVLFFEAPYLKAMDAMYTQEHMPLLKSYLTFIVMHRYAPYADIKLRNIRRTFTMKRYGIQQPRSDEETANRMVQDMLSYELGQIYMKQYGSSVAVADVSQMIRRIRDIYEQRLQYNTWLSVQTKAKAIEKLKTLRIFVGAPTSSDVPLIDAMADVIAPKQGGTLLGNILHNGRLAYEQERQLLGKPFNPDKWMGMDPQDVNACYIPENNSITIPMGILQPPFYSVMASHGTNLGGIGTVIGHEISHAFDTNGSRYDKDGNMKNWWTKADYEAFRKRADAFAPYYDRYVVGKEKLQENGKLVTSEAIADCGGLSAAAEIAKGDPAILKDLYHNFAVIFASKYTPQILRFIVQMDPHPIGSARVNGALSSMPEFYQVYHITEHDGMYVPPQQRVGIW